MRRPEYITAWLFDGIATMPLWLIEKYRSQPLPEHRKGKWALAVDGEFWRWEDAERFENMFVVIPTVAQTSTVPTRNEQIIHGAVARGNAQYWADSRRQEEAFKEWKAAGYEGDCRQCSNGSVVDYITRAIMSLSEPAKKMLEGASSLPSTTLGGAA